MHKYTEVKYGKIYVKWPFHTPPYYRNYSELQQPCETCATPVVISRPPVLQMELSLNVPFLRSSWTPTNVRGAVGAGCWLVVKL